MYTPDQYKKVQDVIANLEMLEAGQVSQTDPYHKLLGYPT